MLTRSRRRSVESSGELPGKVPATPARRASAEEERLLDWIAEQVTGGVTRLPDPLPREVDPHSLTPQQARVAAERWFLLLAAARRRPAACAQAILIGMQTQGFRIDTLTRLARQLCPTVAELRGQPDREYLRAELNYATHPTFENLMALALAMLNHDRTEACRQADEARRLAPERHEPDLCLAQAAFRARLYAEACRHYAEAERKGCTHCFAAHAEAANRANQPQSVLDLCARAGVATSDRLLLEKARALRLLRRVPEALAELASIPSPGPEVAAECGDCYLAQERLKLAADTTEKGAQAGHLDCLRVHGIALARLGHHTEALAALRRLVEQDPVQPTETWYLLAVSALLAGADALALEATEHVLSGAPAHRAALQLQAQALVRLGRYQQALDLCYAHAPQSLLPQPYLALLFIELGEMRMAVDCLRSWLGTFTEHRPPDVLYWILNGYLYERLGRFGEALDSYREAVQANPRYPGARQRYEALNNAIENDQLPEETRLQTAAGPERALTEVTDLD